MFIETGARCWRSVCARDAEWHWVRCFVQEGGCLCVFPTAHKDVLFCFCVFLLLTDASACVARRCVALSQCTGRQTHTRTTLTGARTHTHTQVTLLSFILSYKLARPNAGQLVYCSRTVGEIDKALEEAQGVVAYMKENVPPAQKDACDFLVLGLTSRRNLCVHPVSV